MVVIFKVGRRIPRSFFKSIAHKTAGLLTFQENIWLIINRALQMSKNKCDAMPEEQVRITLQTKEEEDGLHYKFQWKIMTISSIFPEKEKEEYDVLMTLYERIQAIRKVIDKKIETDSDLSATLKNSKIMSEREWEEAKSAGYGSLKNQDISSKLLEMGIITDVKWIPDREAVGISKELIG